MNDVVKARGFPKGSLERNPLLGQWIGLRSAGVVTLFVGKVDIGQGISTVLAQIAAEELDLDPAQVVLAPVNTRDSPDEGVTSGSFSVEHSGAAVRMACATLRSIAVQRFAASSGIPAETVTVSGGCLAAAGTDRSASYWTLGLDAVLDRQVSPQAPLKDRSRYSRVGFSAPRADLLNKLLGRPSFIQDVVLPGMLHCRVVRASNRAARVRALDRAAFEARFPAVRLVRDGSFLGVMAAREEVAIEAAGCLRGLVQWELPALLPDCNDLEGFLRQTPAETQVVFERPAAVADAATLRFAASYSRPFIAHASIGPSCALARWSEDSLEVWTHSQGIFNFKADLDVFVRRATAGARLPEVVVHHVEGSGCYGHNPADDVGFDAVLLARAAGGRPVRVAWSRADELSCGPSGAAHLVDLQADVAADGTILRWSHENRANGYTSRPGRSTPGALSFKAASEIEPPFDAPVALDPPMSAGGGADRNAIPDYDFPCQRIVSHRLLEMPIRTSAIRALGGYTNVWAIESFMDELARAFGADPVAFRLKHLSDPRARAVVAQAVEQAPWWKDKRDDQEGTGRGMAFSRYKNTGAWCAVAVKVHAGAAIRVQHVSIAVDVGLAINPEGVRSQLEGGAIQSCSWTLMEELRFTREQITTASWEDYPILRFSDAPTVQVTIMDRHDQPALGAGEASQGPTAAAIGNAVFDALGIRVRRLPITPERILQTD